jgi:hypothetical protein
LRNLRRLMLKVSSFKIVSERPRRYCALRCGKGPASSMPRHVVGETLRHKLAARRLPAFPRGATGRRTRGVCWSITERHGSGPPRTMRHPCTSGTRPAPVLQ